jgi:hypothetical protein
MESKGRAQQIEHDAAVRVMQKVDRVRFRSVLRDLHADVGSDGSGSIWTAACTGS